MPRYVEHQPAKQNKKHCTAAKYSGMSRCRHETYKVRCLNAISPDSTSDFVRGIHQSVR